MKTEQGLQIAEVLFEKCYGNISECKAEIEQLKAENNVLRDGVAKAFTNGFNTGREQVEKDIRRAKIDVLNELKTYSYCDNDFMDGKWHRYVFVDDIDELCAKIKRGGKNDAEI